MRKLIAAVALGTAMVASPSWAAGFSICAVGDSITQGGNTGFVAHRIALEHVLDANDWSVEWKGTRTDPSWGSSQPCEGYSGQNAQSVAANYVAHAASVVADVLLLHAGHNYNVDPDTSDPVYMPEADIVAAATNAHAQIIAAARAQNPNVIVLYAQVITGGKLPKYSYIPALNSGIAALAVELNTTASPVVAQQRRGAGQWHCCKNVRSCLGRRSRPCHSEHGDEHLHPRHVHARHDDFAVRQA